MSKEIKYRFRLKLLEESWGKLKKGDIDFFFMNLLDEQNGLARFPIDKRWEIVSCDEYTGKNDIHGNEIYNGDILKNGSIEYPHLHEVYWDERYGWSERLMPSKQFVGSLTDSKYIVPIGMKLEIVGNIYNDQKLLNKKNENGVCIW